MRQPARVAAAVLVGPTMDRRARRPLAQIWRLLRDGRRESLAAILTQSGDYIRFGGLRTLRTLRLALADPIERKLPAVAAPTLVVRGEHDPIAPVAWCAEVAGLLPRGELLEIPGAPHALNYDFPGELSRATRAFLSRHPQIWP
jgi:pimeloyl-ACP methyl ester carboxylesterase